MKKATGFTLVELLLVLVLVGIGTGLAVVSVDRLAGRTQENRWIDRTQQELRRLRNKAVLGNRPVEATLDLDRGMLSTREGTLLDLPDGYTLQSVPSRPTASRDQTMGLVFFADGTMEETHFALVTPSGLRQEFRLDRVSGRIERVARGVAP